MEKDYLTACAIIVIGLLSGLNHKAEQEDDPTCVLNQEVKNRTPQIFLASGVTILNNWPKPGEQIYFQGDKIHSPQYQFSIKSQNS